MGAPAAHVRHAPPSSTPAAAPAADYSADSGSGVQIGPAGPPPAFLAAAAAKAEAAAAAAAAAAKPKRKDLRVAGGKVWEDKTLDEWPENDFRLFVGDLAPEVDNKDLAGVFAEYPSFQMARVIYEKPANKSKGFGFVSLMNVMEAAKAIRDKNRKYLRSRPITVRWSQWHKRSLTALSKGDRKDQMRLVQAASSINPAEASKQRLKEKRALKRRADGSGRGRGRGRGMPPGGP